MYLSLSPAVALKLADDLKAAASNSRDWGWPIDVPLTFCGVDLEGFRVDGHDGDLTWIAASCNEE